MRCLEIMKRDVECLVPADTAQVAAGRMRDENVGFLPICDPDGKVLGAITDRDLTVRVLADGGKSTTPVRDIMSRDIVSCRPEDDLERAQNLMVQHHKSRIMCLDSGGRLIGVISLSDIAQREDARRAGQTLRGVSAREARA